MARRKQPEVSPEERERLRRLAADEQRARCAAAVRAVQPLARAWLAQQGGTWVAVLERYRLALVQTSAPMYRPTPRQLQARPCPGIDVEVEF